MAKSTKLPPKVDSQDEEMEAISVMICRTDDFYNDVISCDEEIDYVRFKQPYMAIIIYKSQTLNKIILSVRNLMDIQSRELFELPLDIDCTSNINTPYILTR